MKKMPKSLARGYSHSRISCGGSLRAGLSPFLPTVGIPVVVQNLTPSQIARVPKDRVGVKVIGPASKIETFSAINQARRIFPNHKIGVVVRGFNALDGIMTIKDNADFRNIRLIKEKPMSASILHRDKSRTLKPRKGFGHVLRLSEFMSNGATSNDEQDGKLVTILDNLGKTYHDLKDFQNNYNKKKNSDDGDGLPPDHGIFLSPIDENEMADCTLKIKNDFFGGKDTCEIAKSSWNLTGFCLLMFLAFGRMRILKNLSRKPFCEYLQQKVFMGDKELKVKNFNNYANHTNYQNLEMKLREKPFNLSVQLTMDNDPYYLACHEIGRSFHNSKYFELLRSHRRNLSNFEL